MAGIAVAVADAVGVGIEGYERGEARREAGLFVTGNWRLCFEVRKLRMLRKIIRDEAAACDDLQSICADLLKRSFYQL